MTETTCIATMFQYPEQDTTGSVGRALPGLDLKLVDEEGNDISDYDVRGEMCVRGPSVINGYLDNPEANKSWDRDGYFHTGDIMYRDSKSKLWYIVDRKKVSETQLINILPKCSTKYSAGTYQSSWLPSRTTRA
jgi:4-coumarate--CoA ligase